MVKEGIHISTIIEDLNLNKSQIKGNIDTTNPLKYIKPSKEVDEYSLDWISLKNKNKQELAEHSLARVIICDHSVIYSNKIKLQNKVLLYVDNPKAKIAQVGNKFFTKKPYYNIDKSASINDKTSLSERIHIGSNCNIGKCKIGNNVIIHAGVTIYDDVEISDNVIIHSGAVLGTDGLGCERLEDNTLIKFPHLGKLIIEDNVEVGSNSYIARGALTDTIIGKGTKINGLCFIAHNVKIGENVLITGHVMIAGSATIKNNVMISPGVTIREQVTIGEGAHIGLGAVVTKNVPNNETWIGIPAKKMQK